MKITKGRKKYYFFRQASGCKALRPYILVSFKPDEKMSNVFGRQFFDSGLLQSVVNFLVVNERHVVVVVLQGTVRQVAENKKIKLSHYFI
jgi:hypothetical protein